MPLLCDETGVQPRSVSFAVPFAALQTHPPGCCLSLADGLSLAPSTLLQGAGLLVKTTWVPGSRELKHLGGKNTGIVSWGKWDGFE